MGVSELHPRDRQEYLGAAPAPPTRAKAMQSLGLVVVVLGAGIALVLPEASRFALAVCFATGGTLLLTGTIKRTLEWFVR